MSSGGLQISQLISRQGPVRVGGKAGKFRGKICRVNAQKSQAEQNFMVSRVGIMAISHVGENTVNK
jgi:hypothetical protein